MLHSRVVNKGQLLEEEQFDPVGGRYSISQPETKSPYLDFRHFGQREIVLNKTQK